MARGRWSVSYNPAFMLTLDPNVSYVDQTSITATHGLLVTDNVHIYSFVTGLGTALGTIKPDAK
jgi:hypothetical protein